MVHGLTNLKEKRLFIDGEGKKGDSQWILSMKNDTLIFQSTLEKLYLIAKKMEIVQAQTTV